MTHSPRHPARTLLLAALALLLMLGCSFAPVLSSFQPTPTFTLTIIPSATQTPSPTATQTPTDTPSPTPIPPRWEAREQPDYSILLTDLICFYEITLPSGWEVTSDDLTTTVRAARSRGNGDFLEPNLNLFISTSAREDNDVTLALYRYTAEVYNTGDSILSQRTTTNAHGVELGLLKMSEWIAGLLRPTYYQTYDVLYLCGDDVVRLHFYGMLRKGDTFTGAELGWMQAIQDSIVHP